MVGMTEARNPKDWDNSVVRDGKSTLFLVSLLRDMFAMERQFVGMGRRPPCQNFGRPAAEFE